jgi:hypothetical protein
LGEAGRRRATQGGVRKIGQKYKRCRNIQQQIFAGGHPPNYSSADLELGYGRADGIPHFLQSMVVCGSFWLI